MLNVQYSMKKGLHLEALTNLNNCYEIYSTKIFCEYDLPVSLFVIFKK